MTQNHKIIRLLESNNLMNLELAFQLCVNLKYDEEVATKIRTFPILCLQNHLEMKYFQSLEKLKIPRSTQRYEQLPPAMFQLEKLKYLDISLLGLKEISPKIAKLVNLENLNLSHNFKLQALPMNLLNSKNSST